MENKEDPILHQTFEYEFNQVMADLNAMKPLNLPNLQLVLCLAQQVTDQCRPPGTPGPVICGFGSPGPVFDGFFNFLLNPRIIELIFAEYS
jgi:hypothetical protein